jgi:hypothetical protein
LKDKKEVGDLAVMLEYSLDDEMVEEKESKMYGPMV